KTRRAGDPPVSREEFERILAVCDLPYSLTWADATYEMCNGEVGVQGEVEAYSGYGEWKAKKKKRKALRTREQFWAAFGATLVSAGDDCDDLLCG
ncbi:unnamed protein product, partial [Ectocarpus sp. 13 AM-2016]